MYLPYRRIGEKNNMDINKTWNINPAESGDVMESISDEIVSYVPDELKMATALIFEETYMNVANHAYTGTDKPLTIEFTQDGENNKLVFVDNGMEFDPTKYNPGDCDPKQIGGHGIRLMKELSKSITYNRMNNKNYLEITF